MSFVDRIRRFWSPAPPPDHALSEEEREDLRWASVDNEKAHALETIVGGESEPDDDRSARY